MRYVKLKQAGESITIGVESCQKSETGQYPDVAFIGMDGTEPVTVNVPLPSTERQMERLGLATFSDFAGKIVTISRDPNKKDATKPYWGISVKGDAAKTNGTPKQASVVRSTNDFSPEDLPEEPPPVEEAFPETSSPTLTKLDALFGLYAVCFSKAVELACSGEAKGLSPDVSAIAATLFIAAQNNGIKSR